MRPSQISQLLRDFGSKIYCPKCGKKLRTIQNYTNTTGVVLWCVDCNRYYTEHTTFTYNSEGQRISLNVKYTKFKPWTAEEKQYLIDHYQNMTCKEISQHLNRTTNAIQAQVNRMQLKKT